MIHAGMSGTYYVATARNHSRTYDLSSNDLFYIAGWLLAYIVLALFHCTYEYASFSIYQRRQYPHSQYAVPDGKIRPTDSARDEAEVAESPRFSQ